MAKWAQIAGRRWTDDECRQVVETWARSGLSLLEFARAHGVTWQKVARAKGRVSTATATGASAFLPVTLRATETASASSATLRVGALTIEVASLESLSPKWLTKLALACESLR